MRNIVTCMYRQAFKQQHHIKVKVVLTAMGLSILLTSPGNAQDKMRSYDSLPDWSGVWSRKGGTAFDEATWTMNGEPADPGNRDTGVNAPGTRAHPPYNAEWEAIYSEHVALREKGQFPDPLTSCIPHGFPRIFNVNSPVEFVIRPEQVWILAEHTSSLMRVYTDGRPHPEDPWHTYFGDSVGHWEDDTLVFTTIGLKGWSDRDVVLDRSGLVLSEDAHATTRIQRVKEQNDSGELEDVILVELTLEDPQALTKPWVVEKRFYKEPQGTRIYDYVCNENNRNVIDADGRSLFLGPNGELIR